MSFFGIKVEYFPKVLEFDWSQNHCLKFRRTGVKNNTLRFTVAAQILEAIVRDQA